MATFITVDRPVATIAHVKKDKRGLWKLFTRKRKDDKEHLIARGEEDSCMCSLSEWIIMDGMKEAGF